MKIHVEGNKRLIEMALINPPVTDNTPNIEIWVRQRNEGSIPHIHVYHDKTQNPRKCSYVRLDIAGYHHDSDGKGKPLGSYKDTMIELLDKPWSKYHIEVYDLDENNKIQYNEDGDIKKKLVVATGYEAAVIIWIDTYGVVPNIKFNIDSETGHYIRPNYEEM